MIEATNELMHEVLKRIQERLDRIEDNTRVLAGDMQAVRTHMAGAQRYVANIYDRMTGHELRLERIERRLNLIGEPTH